MTPRLTWQPSRYNGWNGRAGRLSADLFTIHYVGGDKPWRLISNLPGYKTKPVAVFETTDAAKLAAEHILGRFLADLAATPEPSGS